MRSVRIYLALAACLTVSLSVAQAQSTSDQPVVFSQTVIAIVPGSVVPKASSQSPDLQNASSPAEDSQNLNDIKDDLKQPIIPQVKLRVQVRAEQIPLDSGIFHNYILDDSHGVLTYYADAIPRSIIAENIQKPLDILFVRDDGIIGQIIPEVVPAYLTEDITVKFPLRALLYIQAGLAQQWGIQPGYRIEHGMFRPKPMIYTTPDDNE